MVPHVAQHGGHVLVPHPVVVPLLAPHARLAGAHGLRAAAIHVGIIGDMPVVHPPDKEAKGDARRKLTDKPDRHFPVEKAGRFPHSSYFWQE